MRGLKNSEWEGLSGPERMKDIEREVSARK
jgi:hypothetical protein